MQTFQNKDCTRGPRKVKKGSLNVRDKLLTSINKIISSICQSPYEFCREYIKSVIGSATWYSPLGTHLLV